jgi:hypothetical protein
MFAHLRQYKESKGHANVPKGFVTEAGVNLGSWSKTQRDMKNNGKLRAEREERLEEISFKWGQKKQTTNT